MNKLLVMLLLALAMSCVARAQDQNAPSPTNDNAAIEPGNHASHSRLSSEVSAMLVSAAPSSALLANARVSSSFSAPSLHFAPDFLTISAAMGDPAPAAPAPRFVFGGRDDFRWQLGLGMSILRFRSALYYATGVGTNTSITYFTNDWFGIEGRVTTAFSPTTYIGSHVKFAGYGAGPKLAWREQKFEPFVHAIIGGVHVLPQSAAGNANGFEFQLGGGMGYRFNPRLSTRLTVDWLRTRLFSEWQDDAQVALEAVLHF